MRFGIVARFAPRFERRHLLGFGGGIDTEIGRLRVAGQERRRRALGKRVDADDGLRAGFDRLQAARIRFDEALFHVALFDRGDGAANSLDLGQLGARGGAQLHDFRLDHRRAGENIVELEQIGFVRHDLLQAQRPLLIPRPRQAERFVPGRQLHGAGARILAQHHRQHFEQDAVDVVLRLLFREPQGIDLNAIAEAAQLFVGDAVALAANFVPQPAEGAQLAHLGDEAQARIHEKTHAPDHGGEIPRRHLARGAHAIENRDRVGEREGELLHRRGTRFLQMIGADIDRVPLRQLAISESDRVRGELQRWLGRENIGPAREIFLDDVVLRRAGEFAPGGTLLFRDRDVERQATMARWH